MNNRRFLTLGIVAVVLLALALWVAQPDYNQHTTSRLFLPKLSGQLSEIDHLSVFGGSETARAELKKVDNKWTLQQRSGYPADSKKVGGLLIAVAEANIAETKTAKAENHAKLELEDPLKADAKSQLVKFGGGGKDFAVVIGKQERGGSYVRRDGQDQTYLLDRVLTVPNEATDWLETNIVDLSSADVSAVDETAKNTPPVHLARGENDLWQLSEIPKGRKAKAASMLGAAAGSLSGLYFSDVRPASELKGDPVKHAEFHAKGGLHVEASGYEADGDTWVVFSARVDPLADASYQAAETEPVSVPPAVAKAASTADAAKPEADQSASDKAKQAAEKAASDKAAAAKKAHDEALDKARDITARVDGWAYKLPGYKLTELFKSMDDLLEPLEDEKKSESKSDKK